MKVLYIECGMGCAGDMLLGALVDTMENPDAFVDQLNKAGIPCVHYQREVMKKLGIAGTKMHVLAHDHEEGEHHDHHHHHGMPLHEIDDILACSRKGEGRCDCCIPSDCGSGKQST